MHDIQEALSDTIQTLWRTSFAEAGTVRTPQPEGEHLTAEHMKASVAIGGAFDGELVVTCTTIAAQMIASRLLHCELESLDDSDIRDSLGEVANICCGNLKSTLPSPTFLSPPTVFASAASQKPESDHCQARIVIALDRHDIVVRLYGKPTL